MPIDFALHAIVRAVAQEIAEETMGFAAVAAAERMTASPEHALELFDLVAELSRAEEPDDSEIEACLFLIEQALTSLRNLSGGLKPGTEALAVALRDRLAGFVAGESMAPSLLLYLLNRLIGAGLPVEDSMREMIERVSAALPPPADDADPQQALLDHAAMLLEDTEGDVFEAYGALSDVIVSMPAENRLTILSVLLQAEEPELRDMAVVGLLDREPALRQGLAALLAQDAGRRLSQTALRWMIEMRNWLPEAERPGLDAAITAARRRGIGCATQQPPTIKEIYASGVDGSGCLTLLTVFKRGQRRFGLAALLVRLHAGVIDAWVRNRLSKREIDDMLADYGDVTDIAPVTHDLLRLVVEHGIAVGLTEQQPPPHGLLAVAEATGLAGLQPRRQDAKDLIDAVADGLEPPWQQPAMIDACIANSADLLDRIRVADSWFEDDPALLGALAADGGGSDDLNAAARCLLEPHRERWLELFAWTAAWLKSRKRRPAGWSDLTVIARELRRGRPLAEIPLMQEIAARSLAAAAMREHAE